MISNNTLYYFEILCATFYVLGVLISKLLGLSHTKKLLFSICSLHLIAISLRLPDYNSDTWNYHKYLEYIIQSKGIAIFFVSKFELYHLFLAFTTNDFRIWLIFESLTAIFLLYLSIKKIRSIETLTLVISIIIPLFSSSVRFALALLLLTNLIQNKTTLLYKIKFLTVSILAHISIVLGILVNPKNLPLTLLLFISIYIGLDNGIISERAVLAENQNVGLRSFTIAAFHIIYIKIFKNNEYKNMVFFFDLFFIILVLIFSNIGFGVFNRLLLIFIIVRSMNFDISIPIKNRISYLSHIYSFTVAIFILGTFYFKRHISWSNGIW